MPLRIHPDGEITGLRDDFRKYELAIFSGKITCPFTARFLATRYRQVWIHTRLGPQPGFETIPGRKRIVARGAIPLDINGKPKIDIFAGERDADEEVEETS